MNIKLKCKYQISTGKINTHNLCPIVINGLTVFKPCVNLIEIKILQVFLAFQAVLPRENPGKPVQFQFR